MNSVHQLWSKWTVVVRPSVAVSPSFSTVQSNTARFIRKGFGTTGVCQIRQCSGSWVIEFLVDSQRHPHDEQIFTAFSRSLTEFFRSGFGPQVDVKVSARLMAGERLDGQPADQLVCLPRIGLHDG